MTERWTSKIEQLTRDFSKEFKGLTAEQLNWKPNGETWSIGQNIDHLIVINESYYPVIKELRKGTYQTPFIAKIGFMVRFLGNLILKSVQPDRRKKMKTFPIWEPATSRIGEDILDRFVKHQNELKEWIINCAGLLDKGTVISSPANKNIVYKLETALDIIVTHEQRHLEQSRELMAMQKHVGEDPIANG